MSSPPPSSAPTAAKRRHQDTAAKPHRVVIACGGTGGHLFPGVAVAEALRDRGHQALLLVSEKEIDRLALESVGEFEFRRIGAIGMPRLLSPAILGFLWRLRESVSACRKMYRGYRPAAVLGMGGFTSMPPIMATRRSKTPAFIHESNAIPGKANKFTARYASVVLLGFQECRSHFPGRTCEVTGTPIRSSLQIRQPREDACRELGLDPGKTTLLVMGGSQGARTLNELIIHALPKLAGQSIQAVHLAGSSDQQRVLDNYRRLGVSAFVAPFYDRMELAYAAADLAVVRSGAASLAELAHGRVPAILVPYPFAAEDHQTRNAMIFSEAGAAELVQERAIDGPGLGTLILKLIGDPGRLQRMRDRLADLSPGNAAARVADMILSHLNPVERHG